MISYNVVVGDTLSKVLVRFVPSLGTSMGSVRFFIVFLVTLVCFPHVLCFYDDVRCNKFSIKIPFSVCHDAALLVQKRFTSRQNQFYKVKVQPGTTFIIMNIITLHHKIDFSCFSSSFLIALPQLGVRSSHSVGRNL